MQELDVDNVEKGYGSLGKPCMDCLDIEVTFGNHNVEKESHGMVKELVFHGIVLEQLVHCRKFHKIMDDLMDHDKVMVLIRQDMKLVLMVRNMGLGWMIYSMVQEWLVHKRDLMDQNTEKELAELRMEHKVHYDMAQEKMVHDKEQGLRKLH